MSGVFGVADTTRSYPVGELIVRMSTGLSHRPWYQHQQWTEAASGVALGCMGIGQFNRDPQPVWNAERTVALMMSGEVYEVGEVIAAPEQRALATYETHGPHFARQLHGAFVVAIWDARQQRLLVTNDRFAMYATYYTYRAGRLIFAPEMKGVLCDADIPRRLDMTALAQYVRFQSLLETRTFFEDVQQLSPASVLILDLTTGKLQTEAYWCFADIPYRPSTSFDDAAVEVGRLLRQAVRRSTSDAFRPGVYLSGGLDSRTLLGLTQRRPVSSLTYGARNSRDVFYAEQIARTVGSEHHWFELSNGNWVTEHVDLHLELTEGFHSWIHGHGISTLAQARELIDVNLSGWDGGTVMGHPDSIEPLQTQAVDEAAFTCRQFELFNQKWTWPGITEAEECSLYQPATWSKLRGLALDSFNEAIQPYLSLRPDIRGELFFVRNHCGRLTHNMITFYRSHMEVRFPFFDYELFDFLYSLPSDLRADRKLYRSVIQRETPALAYIPYDQDEFLPTTNRWRRAAHAFSVKLARRVQPYAKRLIRRQPTLYADYEAYLRGELRAWAESILFDPRTAERQLFNPAFLRTLMARHTSGLEQWTIGKIAPLMTYEMMARRFLN
ncbi:MAG: asparagine synthetase B family protein [Anaerolineales bacterium]